MWFQCGFNDSFNVDSMDSKWQREFGEREMRNRKMFKVLLSNADINGLLTIVGPHVVNKRF